MLINYEVLVLEKLLSFFLIAVNIFGLWPFTVASNNRHIKYNYRKAFYSALVLCFLTSTYWIIGEYVFRIIRKKHFNTFTLNLVTSINGFAILTLFVFVYIVPHVYRRRIEITFSKCREVVDVMNEMYSHKHIDIWANIIDMVVKTVVFEIIVVVLSLQFFNRSTNNSVSSKMYALILLPPIAVRLHTNAFYGALHTVNVYFRKLNESLKDIIFAEGKTVESRHDDAMGKDCALSCDGIDGISILYFRLTEAMQLVNEIFSFTITLGHALILIALTIQTLLFFVGILEIVRQEKQFAFLFSVFGWIFILLQFYDLYTTAFAAEKLVNEANKTAIILHKANVAKKNTRLQRSIGDFSARLLCNQMELKECGMLNLNLGTIKWVVSSIVSNSVILLQFELAERKKMLIDGLRRTFILSSFSNDFNPTRSTRFKRYSVYCGMWNEID